MGGADFSAWRVAAHQKPGRLTKQKHKWTRFPAKTRHPRASQSKQYELEPVFEKLPTGRRVEPGQLLDFLDRLIQLDRAGCGTVPHPCFPILRKSFPELIDPPLYRRPAINRSRGLDGRVSHLSLNHIQRNLTRDGPGVAPCNTCPSQKCLMLILAFWCCTVQHLRLWTRRDIGY